MKEPMATPILQIKDLRIEFGNQLTPITVVKDFTLDLFAGEIVGIVGDSGTGKSVLAMTIAGLASDMKVKKSGEVLFAGKNLLDCPRDITRQYLGKDISIIFQEPMTALNPLKRIGWQIEESLRIHTDLDKEMRYKKVLAMLNEVELISPRRVYQQYPHELSGGMRQRVMIAMAMICTPKILIADEITTALDVIVTTQIMKLLTRLCEERKTAVLFISHDIDLVKRLCSRIVMMETR
ncbi:MAG: ABC transporter ATP-binding protein [Lachnospiraceae bacterium]|nr:ABC transporter ATP-binding protein [Lachnospiraceae bacterium]